MNVMTTQESFKITVWSAPWPSGRGGRGPTSNDLSLRSSGSSPSSPHLVPSEVITWRSRSSPSSSAAFHTRRAQPSTPCVVQTRPSSLASPLSAVPTTATPFFQTEGGSCRSATCHPAATHLAPNHSLPSSKPSCALVPTSNRSTPGLILPSLSYPR